MAGARQQISAIQLEMAKKEQELQIKKFEAEERRWLALEAAEKEKADLEKKTLLMDIEIKNKQL